MGGVDLPASDLEVSQQSAVREEITVFVSLFTPRQPLLSRQIPSAHREGHLSFDRKKPATPV
jgi:hypothetical protein